MSLNKLRRGPSEDAPQLLDREKILAEQRRNASQDSLWWEVVMAESLAPYVDVMITMLIYV